jgi:hypothetical protein
MDSKIMDEMYAAGLLNASRQISREAAKPAAEQIEKAVQEVVQKTNSGKDEVMLLQRWNGKLIAEAFHLPQMEVEIERAVEQVESAIKKGEKPPQAIDGHGKGRTSVEKAEEVEKR